MPYADQLLQFKAQLESLDLTTRETDDNKVTFLKSLEQEVKDEILSKLYTKTSPDELIELADVFRILADIRIRLGNITHDLKYYTDASIRLKYVTNIIDANNFISSESFAPVAVEMKLNAHQKLNEIHHHISRRTLTDPEDHRFMHKDILIDIRRRVTDELSTTKISDVYSSNEEQNRLTVAKLRDLYADITHSMKDYLRQLFDDAEDILGRPPCEYSVIGLGSMALQQITPYSDLEFAILTENDEYKQSTDTKIRDYFQNLTHCVHFKVILLGESTIPKSDYDLDLYNLINKAVRFDSGDKTPLGGVHHGKPYSLIQTIDEMLRYVKNDDSKIEYIDKHLPYILEKVCFIHGSEEIYSAYQASVNDFLLSETDHGQKQCEVRAIKRLSVDDIAMDYTKPLEERKAIITHGNLEQFSFRPYQDSGKVYDVKNEIYRLVDRFIYNLSLLCGVVVEEGSGWHIVAELLCRNKISEEGANRLFEALSFASKLRLMIYDFYGYQSEKMDIRSNNTPNIKNSVKMFRFTDEELAEDSDLFRYYYTVLPLTNQLKEFCDEVDFLSEEKKGIFFFDKKFYMDDSAENKGQIFYRLMKYDQALEYYEKSLATHKLLREAKQFTVSNVKAHAHSLTMIGNTHLNLGQAKEALKLFQDALVVLKDIYYDSHLQFASCLGNIGSAYAQIGCHKESIEYFKRSLIMMRTTDSGKSLEVVYASTYNRSDCTPAVRKFFQNQLTIWKSDHGEHPVEVATCLGNLGVSYINLGLNGEALKCLEESLAIWQSDHGNHRATIAVCLNNIGLLYAKLGRSGEALKCLEESLTIWKSVYGENYLEVAYCLSSIGRLYKDLGNYEKALKCLEESLAIWQSDHGDHRTTIAVCLCDIGLLYKKLGLNDEALKYLEESLAIWKSDYGENNQDIVMKLLSKIGFLYKDLSNHEKGLERCYEALAISKLVYGKNHPSTIAVQNDIDIIWEFLLLERLMSTTPSILKEPLYLEIQGKLKNKLPIFPIIEDPFRQRNISVKDKKEQEQGAFERKIIDKFQQWITTKKQGFNCRQLQDDLEISGIKIDGIKDTIIKEYCTKHLSIDNSDITIDRDDDTCSISLNKKSVNILLQIVGYQPALLKQETIISTEEMAEIGSRGVELIAESSEIDGGEGGAHA